MESSQQDHPTHEATLVQLIERAQQIADPAAFDGIYMLFAEDVHRYALTRCRDSDWAEEITAAIFMRLIERIKLYRIAPKNNVAIFSAWLHHMVNTQLLASERPLPLELPRRESAATSSKLDRFTKDARRALTLAQEEALRLNHEYIGPEHLLLGLVRTEPSIAVKVLRDMRVEPAQVIRAVERAVSRGERAPTEKPKLVQQSRRAIEWAVYEARMLGDHYISSEHMLLGLVTEEDNAAVSVLRSLGINVDRLRTETARAILQGQQEINERQKAHRSQAERMIVDLTAAAQAGTLDPLIGRQAELSRLLQILCRRSGGSALLVGEPGVGKQTLLHGLAQQIVQGQAPVPLLDRRLLILDSSFLVPGKLLPTVEDSIQQALDECIASNAILCIDNLHTWASAAGSGVAVAHRLKLALNRGDLHVIGMMTQGQYDDSFGPDAAHDWSLQTIRLDEPSPEVTLSILRGIKELYERHHRVVFADETLRAAVALSVRYVTDRFLPAKAIDLIDEAGSRARIERTANFDELRRILLEWKQAGREKEAALQAQRWDEAIAFRRQEVELEASFNALRRGEGETGAPLTVTSQDVAAVVAQWIGLPPSQITQDENGPDQAPEAGE